MQKIAVYDNFFLNKNRFYGNTTIINAGAVCWKFGDKINEKLVAIFEWEKKAKNILTQFKTVHIPP